MARSSRLLGALLGLALCGCATVPTSGPVEQHTQQAASVDAGVHVDPLPPAANASQLLVVEGFLHAMSTYQPNYAVARQYLTDDAAARWRPESGVQIYADGYPPAEYGQTVMLVAPSVGRLDRSGSFTAATGQGSDAVKHDFEPVRDANGQWRIANPPEGLLVSRYVFGSSFTPATLHYLDAAGTVLVPELRYFAAGSQALGEAVRAQLGEPSSWLGPAVRSPVTGGMGAEDVSIDDRGRVLVTLSAGVENLNGEQRDLLLAQIAATLGSFEQVSTVEVRSGGQLLATQTGLTDLQPDSFGGLSPDNASAVRALVVRRGDDLVRLNESDWSKSSPIAVHLNDPDALAVRSDFAEVAATTGSGKTVESSAVGSTKARTVRTGKRLLRPDYARNGELWTAGSAGVDTLEVYREAKAVKLRIDDLPAGRLVAVKLSPDGVRVALIVQTAERTEVGLAVVVRSDDRIRLTGWHPLSASVNGATSGRALDLGWASPTQISVLQRTAGGDTSVSRVEQDDSGATDIGPTKTSSLVRLAVVPGRKAVVLTDAGSGYRFESDFDWNLALTGADEVTYSG